jgi:H+/Cl- antiporter ClcA
VAYYIVLFLAPNARGSGIPQVMAALEISGSPNKDKVGKLLNLKIIFTKIVSSLFMVIGGGAIGREGPTIQISSSIFEWIYSKIPRTWPRLSQKSYILAGAAAGLAAAFNTPLGGIIFAIEELAQVHMRFFRTSIFTAVIIAGLVAQSLLGPYLYLGYPEVKGINTLIIFYVLLCAAISGLMAILMGKGILLLKSWLKKLSPVSLALSIALIGLITGLISIYVNHRILGSGKELLNEALFTDKKQISWDTVFVRILGPILSFNTGAAGGIFAPSLAAGATVGGFLNSLFHLLGPNANILILSGMVGFLTGITQTPFTSAILVLEMTDEHSIIFYLMVAAFISSMVGQIFQKHSLYEILKMDFMQEGDQKIFPRPKRPRKVL